MTSPTSELVLPSVLSPSPAVAGDDDRGSLEGGQVAGGEQRAAEAGHRDARAGGTRAPGRGRRR